MHNWWNVVVASVDVDVGKDVNTVYHLTIDHLWLNQAMWLSRRPYNHLFLVFFSSWSSPFQVYKEHLKTVAEATRLHSSCSMIIAKRLLSLLCVLLIGEIILKRWSSWTERRIQVEPGAAQGEEGGAGGGGGLAQVENLPHKQPVNRSMKIHLNDLIKICNLPATTQ